MESPVEQLKKQVAANAELVAKLAVSEAAFAQASAKLAEADCRIATLSGDIAKRIEEASAAMQARDKATADLVAVRGELATANDTISGKHFRHVAGAAPDAAAAVAGGGEAGEEQKPFATKADALKAYGAIRDPNASQDFRRQHWAILGLSKPA